MLQLSVIFIVFMTLMTPCKTAYFIGAFAGQSGTASVLEGVKATSSYLSNPNGMFADSVGNLYVAECGNSRIRKIDSNNIINAYAGSGSTYGNGFPATSTSVTCPGGVWADSTGKVFVVEFSGYVIRYVDSSKVMRAFAGNGATVTTATDTAGDGGKASSASFANPTRIMGDTVGNYYVTDYSNQKIRKISSSLIITTFAGTGTASSSADGGSATSTNLYSPIGIFVSSVGEILYVDSGSCRIRSISSSLIITTVAGMLTNTYVGDGFPATSTYVGVLDLWSDTTGVVTFTDNAAVVVRTRSTSGILTIIAGGGSSLTGSGIMATSARFISPYSVAGDTMGKFYVDDNLDCTVRVLTVVPTISPTASPTKPTVSPTCAPSASPSAVPTSSPVASPISYYVTAYAGTGVYGFSGDGGKATAAQFGRNFGLFLNTQSEMYFADIDYNRIRKVDASGTISTVGGNGDPSTSGNGGAVTSAGINYPLSMWGNSVGTLYITQINDHIVRVVSGGIINSFAGFGSSGYSGDGGSATSALMGTVYNVWGDSIGNVFVTDTMYSVVRKIVSSTRIISTFAGGNAGFAGDGGMASSAYLSGPQTLYVDSSGVMYLCDVSNYRIRKVSSGGIISTIVGTANGGANSFNGDGQGGTSTNIWNANGVYCDSTGVLYFDDSGNRRLRLMTLANIVYTYGGNGVSTTTGNNGPASSATFTNPYHLVGDTSGVIYVADGTMGMVRKLINITPTVSPTIVPSVYPTSPPVSAPVTYYITAYAGTGSTGYAGDGGKATAALLGRVLGMFLNTQSELYFADIDYNRIRRIDALGIMSTVGGTGSATTSGNGGAFSSAGVNYPLAVWGSSTGVLYVTQVSDFIVRMVSGGIISTFAGTYGSSGQSGDGGQATSALIGVYNIWGDSVGNVFFTDEGASLVRKVAMGSGIITKYAGIANTCSYAGDGGQATSVALCGPEGLFIDTIGVMFIADRGSSRVRKITSGGIMSTIVGTLVGGANTFNGDGQAGTSTNLYSVANVYSDSTGVLYFSDLVNYRVRMLSLSNIVFTIAGTGVSRTTGNNGPATAATLPLPFHIVGDTVGVLYLSDCGAYMIRKLVNISPTSAPSVAPSISPTRTPSVVPTTACPSTFSPSVNPTIPTVVPTLAPTLLPSTVPTSPPVASPISYLVSVYAGTGASGFAGDGGKATAAQIGRCLGMFLNTQSELYIADIDYNRIRKVDASGIITTVGGTGNPSTSGNGGAFSNAAINFPSSVWGTSLGSIYVTQYNDHIVRFVNGGIINTFVGVGTAGYSGDGGQATAARISGPYNVWGDSIGNVYVTDENYHVVRKVFSSTGIIDTYAGGIVGGFAGDGGMATSAYLNNPHAIFVDSVGILYLCDFSNHRIRKITTDGIINTIVGTAYGGSNSFNGDGQAGTSTNLNGPSGVFSDSSGVLYFNDRDNNRARLMITASKVYTFAGTGVSSTTGNNVPATSATFSYPYHVVGDTSGVIYVADGSIGMIRKLINISPTVTPTVTPTAKPTTTHPTSQPVSSPATYYITGYVGTGSSGYSGDGGKATAATIKRIIGMYLSTLSELYLTDIDNNRIRKVDASEIMSTYGGIGSASTSDDGAPVSSAAINYPTAVWGSSTGVMYIVQINDRIVRSVNSGIIRTFAGVFESAGGGIDGVQATTSMFYSPYIVWGDSNGNVFVSDENGSCVRKIVASTGIITLYVGVVSCGNYGDGGPATSAGICGPRALHVDTMGALYVNDVNNNKIRKVTTSGIFSTVVGTATEGGGANTFNGDGQSGTSTTLNNPNGVYCNTVGVLFVADLSNFRMRMMTVSNIVYTVAGTGISGSSGNNGPATAAAFAGLNYPVGDTLGRLFIADSGAATVRKLIDISPTVSPTNAPSSVPTTTHPTVFPVVSPATYFITKYVGTGAYDSTGDGGKATAATMKKTLSMFMNTLGELYLSEIDNCKVRKVDAFGIITTVGGLGSTSTSGDGGAFSSATMRYPFSVWATSTGVLFVSQYADNFVRYVNNGIINTFAGTFGSPGNAGDGGPATSAKMTYPTLMWGDSIGNVFVVDEGAGTIRKIVISTGIVGTSAGTGTGGFSGDGGQATSATFSAPRALYIDTAGVKYLCDGNNNRVRKIVSNGIVTTIMGTSDFGSYNGDGLPGTSTNLYNPNGIFVDSVGVVYVAELLNQRFRLMSLSGLVYTIAGTGVIGSSGDDGPASAATFFNPYCLIGNTAGVMYLTTEGAATVRKLINISPTVAPTMTPTVVPTTTRPTSVPIASPITYLITKYAGTGGSGFSGDGGKATAASIKTVLGMFLNTLSELYLVDGNNNRIRKVDASGTITTVGGSGSPSSFGDGGAFSNAGINYPVTIWGTSLGTLYVTQINDLTVRVVSGGIISTFAGLQSTSAYSGDGGPATSARFLEPHSVWGDSLGNVFISDTVACVVRKVAVTTSIVTTYAGTGVNNYLGDGGQATSAYFSAIVSLSIDSSGVLYLGDIYNNRVRKVTAVGIVTTIVGTSAGGGNSFNGDGLPGTSSNLWNALGVYCDTTGAVYFNDYLNARLRFLSVSNIVYTVAGTGVSGTSGDNGPASAAALAAPYHNVGDTLGVMYTSDASAPTIRKLVNISPTVAPTIAPSALPSTFRPSTIPVASPMTYYISGFVGTGSPGSSGDGGKATAATIKRVLGMFLNTNSELYIADIDNNRIRKVDSSGSISTVGGTGAPATSGDGGAYSNAGINYPISVWGSSLGVLYIVQINDHIIRSVSTSGIISTFAGVYLSNAYAGDGGQATAASFQGLYNVWGDSVNNVYVTDESANVVRKIVVGTGIITTYVGGLSGFGGDSGQATSAYIHGPRALHVDSSGVMYLCDRQNNRIRKITNAGIITTIIGTTEGGWNTFNGDGQAGTSTNLNDPNGVYGDSSGVVYMADLSNYRLRLLSLSSIVYTFAGTGSAGSAGNNGPATAATLTNPYHTVGDTTGVLYIADAGTNVIRRMINISPTVLPTVAPTAVPTSPPVAAPVTYYITGFVGTGVKGFSGDGGKATAGAIQGTVGMFLNTLSELYFADLDNSRIRKVDSSGILTTVGGNGATTTTGNGGAFSSATINSPQAVWGNSQGVLYITQGNDNVVRTVSGGVISAFVGSVGSQSFTGMNGQATSATLYLPYNVWGDSNGNVFVSDNTGSAVVKIVSGIITIYAGGAGCGNGGDGGKATSAAFCNPRGLYVDATNTMYFIDGGNNRVRKVTSAGFMSTIVGTSQGGGNSFNGDGQAGTSTNLYSPNGVFCDSTGLVYFADSYNYRYRILFNSIVYTIAGGTYGNSGNNGPAIAASLNFPHFMVGDTAGVLYISDYVAGTVRKLVNISPTLSPTLIPTYSPSFSPTSPPVSPPMTFLITPYAGTGVQSFSGDGGKATAASFVTCLGMFLTSVGELYLADIDNNRIRKIDASSIITTVGGSGSPAFTGNGGTFSSAQFYNPASIWANSVGVIYIAEPGADVRSVDTGGIVSQFAGYCGSVGYSGDGGAATSAYFNSVYNVWGNTLGTVYISDAASCVVRAVTNGVIDLFAGTTVVSFGGDGGPATSAMFNAPRFMFVDSVGSVYIGDIYNNRIRKVVNGIINTLVGTSSPGSFNGDGLKGTSTALNFPTGIWCDSSGTLYFVDRVNLRVRMMLSTSFVYTIAGNAGTVTSGNFGSATSASFKSVFSLVGDSSGALYVNENEDSLIRKLINLSPTVSPTAIPTVNPSIAPSIHPTSPPVSPPTTFFITPYAGTGVATFAGDGGKATAASFVTSLGMFQTSVGELYLADISNHRIRKIDASSIITTVGGSGSAANSGNGGAFSSASLNSPISIWGNSVGVIYVAERGADVRSVSAGGIINQYAGATSTGFTGDGGAATSALFYALYNVWGNTLGTVYISDEAGCVVRSVSNGIIFNFAGIHVGSFSGDGGPATSASLNQPRAVFVDAVGSVYLGDHDNNRIRKVTSGIINTWIGTYGGPGTFNGDGLKGTSTTLYYPNGIWCDSTGTVFFIDSENHRVRMMSTTSIVYTIAGNEGVTSSGNNGPATSASFQSVFALAADSSGVLLVNEYQVPVVRKLINISPTVSPTAIPTISPSIAPSIHPTSPPVVAPYSYTIVRYLGTGVNGFSGDGAPGILATITRPYGVFVNTAGTLYCTDIDNQRIRMVASSAIVSTVSGSGTSASLGNGGPFSSASFSDPIGIWGNTNGVLYITEHSGYVRKVSASGIISAFAGTGISSRTGDGGPASSATFNNPMGICGDTTGVVYITDQTGSQVRKVDANGIITRLAGTDIQGYSGDSGPPTSIQLYYPQALFADTIGNVFVSDCYNHRIRQVFGGALTTIVGTSLGGEYNGDGLPGTSTLLNVAGGVWCDLSGTMFFADTLNRRVRMMSTSSIVFTVAGTGVQSSTGNGSPATVATFDYVFQVTGDTVRALYVSDTSAFTVRQMTNVSPTVSPTAAPTYRPSSQPSTQPSSQPTRQPSSQPSCHPTSEPSMQPTTQPITRPSVQPSNRPSGRPSTHPSVQPSRQPTSQPSSPPSVQPSRQPSRQPSCHPTSQPSSKPSSQPSTQPTIQPSKQPASCPSRQPSRQPSVQPSAKPSGQPSCQPTAQPASYPSRQPSCQPSAQPSAKPSGQPSRQPTSQPVNHPSSQPTMQPTSQPSQQPSSQPLHRPSTIPTVQPSVQPSTQPSIQPSRSPTSQPIGKPSSQPSSHPSSHPIAHPSAQPTGLPSCVPSSRPSSQPSSQPSGRPSTFPSVTPSCKPSSYPSSAPTKQPVSRPSTVPSRMPSALPSMQPSNQPTKQPLGCPSSQPTRQPTRVPSNRPSGQPTNQPSRQPTSQPSNSPSTVPSGHPTIQPSGQPTTLPSHCPSVVPSSKPSRQPCSHPSSQPSIQPSRQPSRQPASRPSSQPSTQPSVTPSVRPSIQPSSSPSAGPTTLSYHISAPKATLPSDRGLSVFVETPFKIVLPFSQVGMGSSSSAFADVEMESELFGSSFVLMGNKSFPSALVATGNPAVFVHTKAFSSDSHGRSAGFLNDFNDDGRQDLIIGDPYAARCYVLFGKVQGLTNLTDGFTIFGEQDGDLTGWSVSDAGDVNNDTINDIVIGAPNAANSAGAVYVVYGAHKKFVDVYLNNLTVSQGFAMYGGAKGDYYGLTVSNAGDFNDDKCDDIIMGAMITSSKNAGSAFVLFGCQTTLSGSILTLATGFKLTGSAFSKVGYSVSAAGDVNKDGFDDVLIGCNPTKAALTPSTYLLLGSAVVFETLPIANLGSTDGIRITGVGAVVAYLGDINHDGYDDVLMSSVDNAYSGYVVYTNVSSSDLIQQMAASLPTVLPTIGPTSCKPTRGPSRRPTLAPSVIKPTASPTFAPSSPTELPTVGVTQPTSHPSTQPTCPSSRPTELPTLITLPPTEEPVSHSTEPTEEPTEAPSTAHPSIAQTSLPTIAATEEPSPSPSGAPSSLSRRPITLPTLSPSFPPTAAALITVDISGENVAQEYVRLNGVVDYVVNTTSNVTITGSNGAATFIVIPSPKTYLKVEYFNLSTDVIDLTHFSTVHGMKDLQLRSGSVIVDLPDSQIVRIQNLQPVNITSKNFIFVQVDDDHEKKSQTIIIASITAGIVLVVVGLFIACVCMLAARKERKANAVYMGKISGAMLTSKKVFLMEYQEKLNEDMSDVENQLHKAEWDKDSVSLDSYRLSQFSVDSEGMLLLNVDPHSDEDEEEEVEEHLLSDYSVNSRGSFVHHDNDALATDESDSVGGKEQEVSGLEWQQRHFDYTSYHHYDGGDGGYEEHIAEIEEEMEENQSVHLSEYSINTNGSFV